MQPLKHPLRAPTFLFQTYNKKLIFFALGVVTHPFTSLQVMDKMPRNVMGKVNKKEIAKVAFPKGEEAAKTAAQ